MKVCKFNNASKVLMDCKNFDETKETRVVLNELKKSTSYMIEVVALNQAVKGESTAFVFKTQGDFLVSVKSFFFCVPQYVTAS